jgi:DNA-binding transcriptional MocR family regulator
VTNGVSNALDLVCTLFTRPGDTIFVEEPSYFLALRIFRDHGLQAVPVPTDEHGLVIEALEDLLAESRPKFVYIIPTFQNPTGRTLPEERRERLIGLANTHGLLVVADEVYHFLSYTGQPPKPLGGRADAQKVLSLGSFSKILAPGLRLGWIQGSPAELQRLVGAGVLDSGGGLNPFTSAIVGRVIESGGLRQNIAGLIEIYRQRVAFMDSCLGKYLPGVTYAVPTGGYFFWVRLPENMDAAALQQRAEAFKVNFRPGVRFSSRDGLRDYLRLCYVFYGPEQIEEGIARLKQTLEAV